MFGTPSSTPAFGTPSSTPPFGIPSSTPLFGTPSTPAFANGGFGSSLFSTPFTSQTQQQQQQQQQQTSLFQQPSTTGFGFQQQQQQTPFATPLQTTPFPSPPPPQLSTQMALVAPLPFSLADRDIQVCFPHFLGLNPNQDHFLFNMLIKLRLLIAGDCGCL
jgi:nuclear pore complex protein Nup54